MQASAPWVAWRDQPASSISQQHQPAPILPASACRRRAWGVATGAALQSRLLTWCFECSNSPEEHESPTVWAVCDTLCYTIPPALLTAVTAAEKKDLSLLEVSSYFENKPFQPVCTTSKTQLRRNPWLHSAHSPHQRPHRKSTSQQFKCCGCKRSLDQTVYRQV